MEHPLFGVEGAVQVPVSSLNFHEWRLKQHENNDNLFTLQFHEKKRKSQRFNKFAVGTEVKILHCC